MVVGGRGEGLRREGSRKGKEFLESRISRAVPISARLLEIVRPTVQPNKPKEMVSRGGGEEGKGVRLNATEKRKGDGRNAGLEELAVQLQRINLLKRCCCERAKSQTGAKQKTEQARMRENEKWESGAMLGQGPEWQEDVAVWGLGF